MLSQSGPIYCGTLTGGLFARWRPLYCRVADLTFTFINGARFVNGVETRAGPSRAAQTGTRPVRQRTPPPPFQSSAQKPRRCQTRSCKYVELLGFTVIIFSQQTLYASFLSLSSS